MEAVLSGLSLIKNSETWLITPVSSQILLLVHFTPAFAASQIEAPEVLGLPTDNFLSLLRSRHSTTVALSHLTFSMRPGNNVVGATRTNVQGKELPWRPDLNNSV